MVEASVRGDGEAGHHRGSAPQRPLTPDGGAGPRPVLSSKVTQHSQRQDAGGVVSQIEARALRVLIEGGVQRGDLAERLALSDDVTRTVLGRLRDHDLVHLDGRGRGAYWQLGPE